MRMVDRAGWGAKPWTGPVNAVPMSIRTEYCLHYHGGEPPVSIGPGVPKDCEAIHLHNGWSGIGYNWVIDQAGTIYEGRGWGLVGAHCPNHNRIGIGVYIAVGGDQEPSKAALKAARELYDVACNLSNRQLRMTWHGENYPTECPGAHLIKWVKAGMPLPEEDDMALSDDDIDRIVDRMLGADHARFRVHDGDKLIPITDALTEILKLLRAQP